MVAEGEPGIDWGANVNQWVVDCGHEDPKTKEFKGCKIYTKEDHYGFRIAG